VAIEDPSDPPRELWPVHARRARRTRSGQAPVVVVCGSDHGRTPGCVDRAARVTTRLHRELARRSRRRAQDRKALAPLTRSGWTIVHDVQARYGNYDHVAVGPAGVFLLETKNPGGIIELRDGIPHLRRRHDPDAVTRLDRIRPCALAAAANLKEDIQRRTGQRTWVQAVVVLWSDFPEGLVDDGRCIFVHGPRLHALLYGRPNRLNPQDAEKIATAVADIAKSDPSDNTATSDPTSMRSATGYGTDKQRDATLETGSCAEPTAQPETSRA
jgi:hypothetical protein